MTEIPAEIRAAAERRAAARAARDWATADLLRAQIEDAGWKIVDAGTRFRLEPAHAPDVVADGAIRYGRVDSVPSRLGEPDSAVATVVVIATGSADDAGRAVRSISTHVGREVSLVVVADGASPEGDEAIDAAMAELRGDGEVVRTAVPLGYAAAFDIGLRRATGSVVCVLDPSIEATGDVVTPLVRSLDDASVAITGPFGLVSPDLRRYEEVEEGDAAAIEGYLMAFRRRDAAARGPLDERLRFYRNADILWSLVLRDEGAERPPRRAVVTPGLPLVRHEHRGWTSVDPAERDRLSRRNFYRIIDRFGHRPDLAVPRG